MCASCNLIQEALTFDVAMQQVNITTPQVPSGTYTISKEVSVSELDSTIHAKSGKHLDEVTDIAISGVTVSIVTPDTLTFASFSYAKLIVSSGSQSVTLIDTPLSISGRSYPYTLSASIKNVISAARQGNGKLTYSYTVTTSKTIPIATWKIVTKASITP